MKADRPTIMVVDDDNGMRVTLQGIVEEEGYKVVVAEDGYRAIALAESSPVGLVFLDINMPGKTGIEVLRELRARDEDTAVIMVSGDDDISTAVQAWKLGAYDYVVKPFDVDHILLSLERALEMRRLRLENRDYQLSLEGMVAEQTKSLEQRVRELTALNELFQSHLIQRDETEAAYRRLADGMIGMAQEIEALALKAAAKRDGPHIPSQEKEAG